MTYLGHVSGERARRAWAASDAFVLPSYSEGFSMAVLEALACRLPCLITTACHFPELAAAGGAVVVEPTPEESPEVCASCSIAGPRSGRISAASAAVSSSANYTWDRQGRRLAAIYEWLTGGGSPPDLRRTLIRVGELGH